MGVSKEHSCEAGSFFCCRNSHRFLQSEVLRLSFPHAGTLCYSIYLAYSQFIHKRIWEHPVHQPPPRHHPLCPGGLSLPLLPVLMNISSTPWLSDFHTIQFSGSCGCFLFLNLFLSFFWLYEEAKYINVCLHLGQKFYIFQF